MKRTGTISVALLVLLLPSVAFAQRDTKQTREANKFIGLAMTKQTADERAVLYRQAMEHLREGMAEDAENAQVWKLAGTALAALGNATPDSSRPTPAPRVPSSASRPPPPSS
jgi:hypothetical protein